MVFVRASSFLVLSLLLSSCYVSKLAWHQGKLLNSRQKIAALINKDDTPPSLRQQLELSQKILAYAQRQGLAADNAYRYYVELGRNDISYLVRASPFDRLEAKTWWFPLVGDVPYLGYFNEQERDVYAAELAAQGLDIYKTTASAYSSLGWFDDPLYSTMLNHDQAALASLLFHELTHRTLWLSGQAEFNEHLASFVEVYLTRQYLQELNLREELQSYEAGLADEALFAGWIKALEAELSVFYKEQKSEKREQALFLAKKSAIFERFVTQEVPRFKRYKMLGDGPWNNARVLASSTYLPDYQRFYASFRCSKATSIGSYLSALREAWAKQGSDADPYTLLDQFCK